MVDLLRLFGPCGLISRALSGMEITLPDNVDQIQTVALTSRFVLDVVAVNAHWELLLPGSANATLETPIGEYIYCGTEATVVSYPLALAPGAEAALVVGPAPIEYTAAVDRSLARGAPSVAPRRVYRISLVGWAWPLVGKPVPGGAGRRSATPPLVPLALLDDPGTGDRLAAGLAGRAARTDPRTVNRELSALRSAVGWWRDQGWVSADPTAGLRHRQPSVAVPPLAASQVSDLLALPVSLREQALWRVLYDSGAAAAEVLALDADQIDVSRHRARTLPGAKSPASIEWQAATSQILRWLLSGRTWGPVFLTDRRASARTVTADACPLTGQARMSYRRAAEVFTTLTRPLDPAGRGWTLHQLSAAERSRLCSG